MSIPFCNPPMNVCQPAKANSQKKKKRSVRLATASQPQGVEQLLLFWKK